MQTISTRFVPASDKIGARISVFAQAGRMYVPWDHALNPDDNHTAAARAFAERHGWFGRWIGGGSYDGKGSVYVNTDLDYATGAFDVAKKESAHVA